jgi:signal transduction histidine kinase
MNSAQPSLIELGVIDDSDTARLAALLIGGAGALGVIVVAAAILFPPQPAPVGFHPLPILGISALSAVIGIVIALRPELAPARRVSAFMVAGTVGLGVVMYLGGPNQFPYIAMFYVWLGGAFVYEPRRRAALHVAAAVGVYAVVVAFMPRGRGDVFATWLIVSGTLVVAAGTTNWIVDRVTRLALGERTTRQELEQANIDLEVVNQQKRDFLAATSHELRTPLNAIIGFSEVIGEELYGPLNDRQREYVRDICTSGHHLADLIGEVLDVAKVESGRLELEPSAVDITTLLGGAVGLFREQAARRSITLQLDDGGVGVVEGDERKLRQVVVNLLANAMKFTGEGGRVGVTAKGLGTPVQVTVTDTGPGVSVEDQDRIFEAFEQGEHGPALGTGLGLPLARRLVEAHGGRLWLDRTGPEGSTFAFALPRRIGSRSTDAGDAAPPVETPVETDEVRRQNTRFGASLALGAGLLGVLGVGIMRLRSTHIVEYHEGPVFAMAMLGLVLGGALRRVPTVLTTRRGMAISLLFLVMVVLVGYEIGPDASPLVTAMLVWGALAFFVLLPRRQAIAMLGVIGLCHAFLLAVQPGNYLPVVRWTLVMGVCVITGTATAGLIGKLHRLQQIEEAARLEVERSWMELEQVSRHKSEFLANMSHELRTPLNAIIGFADVLRDELFGPLNEKQAEYIVDIVGAGRQLLALINDILDLAKAEAGRIDLVVRDVAIGELVQAGLVQFAAQADARGLGFGVHVDPAIALLQADPDRLGRAVANLISNAVKFSPDGGHIDVDARCVNGEVIVAVHDRGPGIAPADQARIFDEFQRVAPAGLASAGTGLGLALARTFAELHHGRLEVESAPGQGSTFRLALPQSAGKIATTP